MNATEPSADFDLYKSLVDELLRHAQQSALSVWRSELSPGVQTRLLGELNATVPGADVRALARHLDLALFAELMRVIPPLLRDVSDETISSAPNARSIVFALASEAGGAAGRRLIAPEGIAFGTSALAWLLESDLDNVPVGGVA
ncbi:MAG: hypothetical protein ACO1OB_30830 [Archangium sp.]